MRTVVLGTKITAGKETAVTASSKPEGTRKNIVTYHLRAFAPDPRDGDCFFYYDDKVDRTWPIDSGEQFDLLMKGFPRKYVTCMGFTAHRTALFCKSSTCWAMPGERDFISCC